MPAVLAVTNPLASTVATTSFELLQPTVRTSITLLAASSVVAVNCTVWPMTTLGVGGATVTVATGGGVTVTSAEPDLPSDVAVIVAVPALLPVTNPLASTVATASFELLQP